MGIESYRQNKESFIIGYQKGDRVLVRKLRIKEGGTSQVPAGSVQEGTLTTHIKRGGTISLDDGTQSSSIELIVRERHRLLLETETSVYEIVPLFSGLRLANSIGTITLPPDARPAQFPSSGRSSFEIGNEQTGFLRVRINQPALTDVLIETGGSLLHVMGDRYYVLARVGNAHVPFYRSSKGTNGKREGEWYPYFGHTGQWIIKGDIAENGDMEYHPAISAVQKILNENLLLPDRKYFNKELEIRTKQDQVLYSLHDAIKADEFRNSEFWKNTANEPWEAERKYITHLTGYNPTALNGYHPKDTKYGEDTSMLQREWIGDIVRAVDRAQN